MLAYLKKNFKGSPDNQQPKLSIPQDPQGSSPVRFRLTLFNLQGASRQLGGLVYYHITTRPVKSFLQFS